MCWGVVCLFVVVACTGNMVGSLFVVRDVTLLRCVNSVLNDFGWGLRGGRGRVRSYKGGILRMYSC